MYWLLIATEAKLKPQHPCALAALFERGPWTMLAYAQSLVQRCMVPTSRQNNLRNASLEINNSKTLL